MAPEPESPVDKRPAPLPRGATHPPNQINQSGLQVRNPFARAPANRPPRPSPDEYGVPQHERRLGPPPGAVGAQRAAPPQKSPPLQQSPPPRDSPPLNGGFDFGTAPTRPQRPSDDDFSFPFHQKKSPPLQQTPAESPPSNRTAFPFPSPPGANRPLEDMEVRHENFARPRPPPLSNLGGDGVAPPPLSATGSPGTDWPLPSPLTAPRAAPLTPGGLVRKDSAPAGVARKDSAAKGIVRMDSAPGGGGGGGGGGRKDRPPQLNLNLRAGDASDLGQGPWTPPPVLAPPMRLGRGDEERPSTAGAKGGADPGFGGFNFGLGRERSVKERVPEIQGTRRPDFGLVAPTGIADSFGTGFI
jgi:hypothetical protein